MKKKADLTGTEIVMVGRIYGWEYQNIIFYQCQKMGHYTSRFPEKADKTEGVHLLMDRFFVEYRHGFKFNSYNSRPNCQCSQMDHPIA